jgi:hypothetical protein
MATKKSTDPIESDSIVIIDPGVAGSTVITEKESSLEAVTIETEDSFFDDFFSGLTGEQNNDTSPKPIIDEPEEKEPIEQLKLYITVFNETLNSFLDAIHNFPENLSGKEFYSAFGREIKVQFFEYPEVYRFFQSTHENNYAFYSHVENREGVIKTTMEQALQQKELAIEKLTADLAAERALTAHFELVNRQDELAEAVQQLRS